LTFLGRLEDAYGKTSEGRLEALRAEITYWETARTKYKEHAAEIRAILLPLYEQLRKAMAGTEGPALPLGYKGLGLEVAGAGGKFGVGERMGWGARAAEESMGAMAGAAYGQQLQQTQQALEAVSSASVGTAEAFANLGNVGQQSMNRVKDTTLSARDQIVGAFQNMLMSASDWAAFLGSTFIDVIGTGLMAVGEMIVTGADAWSIFRNAALNACAAVLEALGQQLLAWAVMKAMMFDWVSAALAAAGAIAAFIAAGLLRGYAKSLEVAKTANPVKIPEVAGGGGGGGGAGGGYTGSQTTIQRTPDIYVYLTVQGSVYGPGGLRQVGQEVASALQEFAGIGGRIHIEEAIVPVRG